MKQKTLLPILIFIVFHFFTYAQSKDEIKDVKIDPRQYITVQYKKVRNSPQYDTIWNWEERENINEQKVGFIDVDGVLKITFNRVGLIKDEFFEGTVSLAAEIVGSGGRRAIEVSPYSEVGKERSAIGVKSAPPIEITRKLLNMMNELEYFKKDLSINNPIFEKTIITKIQIDSLKKQVDLFLGRGISKDSILPFLNILLDKTAFNIELKEKISISELKKISNVAYEEFILRYNNDRDEYIKKSVGSLKKANEKIEIVLTYLNSFETSGEDAMRALLSMINKDMIIYTALKKNLSNSRDEILKINIKNLKEDDLAKLLLSNTEQINEAFERLSTFARFEGSILDQEIQTIKISDEYYKSKGFPDSVIVRMKSNKNFESRTKSEIAYKILTDNIRPIAIKLSIYAGQIIFQNLIHATIDLNASGAKNGERLNLQVLWTKHNLTDSVPKPAALELGSYYLTETGWQFGVTDMFALVKRLDESEVDPDAVSPSNFKGSGGAVLMWTYNKEDFGLKIDKEEGLELYDAHNRNRLMNFFQPSIGLNVSYLDFSTTKDVEIGTGLQIGLFQNKIFAGYGVNLHMVSPKDQAPTYFFIGFSFAKLGDLFQDHGSVISQN